MIRFAQACDLQEIIKLWESCFPDLSGFNEYYFAHIYQENRNLLYFKDNKLCAMTQMLPYTLRIQQQDMPVTYIYGACTAPEARRHGYMSKLLEESFALDKANGKIASVLIPQEKWLFDFYAQFGYKPSFFLNQTRSVKIINVGDDEIEPLTPQDIPKLEKLYREATADYSCVILRSEAQWLEQLRLFYRLAGGAYGYFQDNVLQAYAFVWIMDDELLWAQECFAQNDRSLQRLCSGICTLLHKSKIEVTEKGQEKPFGCAKFYDDFCAQTGYFNLMFN